MFGFESFVRALKIQTRRKSASRFSGLAIWVKNGMKVIPDRLNVLPSLPSNEKNSPLEPASSSSKTTHLVGVGVPEETKKGVRIDRE